MCARGQRFRFAAIMRVIIKQRRVVMRDHAGAGTRRCDHVIIALEGIYYRARYSLGIGAVPRIIGRLAAAGLARRYFHQAAGFFQQLDGGKADCGPIEIHQAGDKKRNARRGLGHGFNLPWPMRAGDMGESVN